MWCRLVAAALIQPLAWEPPYAAGAAQEIAKIQKKNFEALCSFEKKMLTLSKSTTQSIRDYTGL